MKSSYKVTRLTKRPDWNRLEAEIGTGDSRLIKSLLGSFRSAEGKLCIEEETYIDRDFSAAYAAFYATLYKPYTKYCRRLHFFRSTVKLDEIAAPGLGDRGAEPLADWVAKQKEHYLGYIVVRPLMHAPVSHAVVSARHYAPNDMEISVRSNFKVHLLGVELVVDGIPLTEQDTRTGACAQAAIWTAGRHLHNRHSAPWFSMIDITEAAIRPADTEAMQALPAGSDHLTADSMVRALTAMGERAKVHGRDPGTKKWETAPETIIARYVDSGIPVIVGLSETPNELGHAVVAVGARYDWSGPFPKDKTGPKKRPGDSGSRLGSLANRITHLIVNDDQIGVYAKLPVTQDSATSDCVPFDLAQHAEFILIPLPNKVFMAGEIAEKIAWDKVKSYTDTGREEIQKSLDLAQTRTSLWDVDPDFYRAVKNGLVARTYLTYGWKYKQRTLKNTVSPVLKQELLLLQLPRYVWVTEFSLPGDLTGHNKCTQRVRAHVVVDATGSRFWESVILIHVPGVVIVETFDVSAAGQQAETILRATENDGPYYPKVRGWDDYDACALEGS